MSDVDREIAEKVMGWKTIDDQYYERKNGSWTFTGYGKFNGLTDNFNPSTNIPDVFLVVRHLRDKGWSLKIHPSEGARFCPVALRDSPPTDYFCVDIFGYEKAISLAALQAINNQSKD